MFKFSSLALATTICLVVTTTSSVRAVTINGDFENDFNGWEPTSNATIYTNESKQALLRTSDEDGTEFDNFSLEEFEAFLEISPGSLSNLDNGEVIEGSAIKRQFTANAGDVLTFDWNFLTDAILPEADNDFAFYTISPSPTDSSSFSLIELADIGYPDGTASGFEEVNLRRTRQTNFQRLRIEIPGDGSYTLGLGVVDVNGPLVDSELLVDNVALSSTPVPFEFSPGLGILALGACSAMARLKNQVQKWKFSRSAFLHK